ncbi:Asp-tRNA Asn/Glu-tRNA Gln amidotransferas-like protein subunit A [Dothidotthia symphoricarpi CBS 119687]|uniref:Asp-tRNA Asn/Glu-tRNA Gln amidotransferas-like protein subunit A n=1 Tax=Dothidotthia symphoricarpi CBS 119687 TaxID=1392245 RepID=A0A6A6A0X3_9PLEO|nr:Asp-tRNA Asn/Glu-tRNA Gln amidotransferas-like protein subunit A [Dothidotthia symphoricarpi CBS 119687]KAF2125186.1 Asp-tRNA Asn/Glu-tRNA Gln amidotransferas-like protein subunit A [Dothidotthia symphoricarpi CBS 119687]
MTEYFRLTASQAQAKFKDESLSVEEYAKSLLSRIEARDPVVHAWAYLDQKLILQRARELDGISPEKRGVLHGVAVGVKDVILTKDMPTQHNSPIYEDDAPKLDAASVMLLRANGALIFGKTTTTEFAATTVGPSHKGPKTANPHDPSRTPGGSSSGSGAAVADFQVPVGLGTQTGGSTIRPGSFNGIYAMKPTWNSISREGQKLYSLIFDTLGIYGRSIDDIKLLLDAFQLVDDEPVEDIQIKDAKFALLSFPTPEWPELGPGTVAALQKGAHLLRAHGALVEEITLPDEFRHMNKYHLQVLSGDGRVAFLADYTTSKHHLDPSIVAHVENHDKYRRKEQLVAFDSLAAMRPKLDMLANKYTAIIAPSVIDEATEGLETTGNAAFCAPWTAMHMPVLNVPGFKGNHGLPVGLSLVAARYRDQHLLEVCRVVGRLFEAEGGWKTGP